MNHTAQTQRTQVRRLPERGAYERETIYSILDEGLICHVGFVADGAPFVIPTGYARQGDMLYIHGSAASRMIRALGTGVEACITVTLLDALVLARSVFHHSMNYRSVVILGRSRRIDDDAEKLLALEWITEHLVPGRWREARHPSAQEMKATSVLAFSLAESSAKSRSGPPGDDEADYALPVWAGVLPLSLATGAVIRDERLPAEIELPAYLRDYDRAKRAASRRDAAIE